MRCRGARVAASRTGPALTRRAASRKETRERIVEATAKRHGERGCWTTWHDIAHEVDLSVSTVYAHFPSLDELPA